jgi:hypothetical protein
MRNIKQLMGQHLSYFTKKEMNENEALLTQWMSAVVPTGWYCTQMAQCTHRAHCTSNQLMMECTNQKAANAAAP